MLAPQPVEHFSRRLRTAGLHVGQAALKSLDGLDAIEELLIRLGVLNDDFCPSIDRQDERVSCTA